MSVKEAKSQLDKLVQDRAAVVADLRKMEQESVDLDPSAGADLVERLSDLEDKIQNRRRVLQVLDGKIIEARQDLEQVEQVDRERRAKGVRRKHDKAVGKVVQVTLDLESALADMRALETELSSLRVSVNRVVPDVLGHGVKSALQRWRGFYPHLLGLPPRPTAEEQARLSAREEVKRSERFYKELADKSKRERLRVSMDGPLKRAKARVDLAKRRLSSIGG